MNLRTLRRKKLKQMWRKVKLNMLGKRMAEMLWAVYRRKGFARRLFEKRSDEELQRYGIKRLPSHEEILHQPTYLYSEKTLA